MFFRVQVINFSTDSVIAGLVDSVLNERVSYANYVVSFPLTFHLWADLIFYHSTQREWDVLVSIEI